MELVVEFVNTNAFLQDNDVALSKIYKLVHLNIKFQLFKVMELLLTMHPLKYMILEILAASKLQTLQQF
jgi:hypothetical protein